MRIEKNKLGLDEVVLEECHFHIERMDDKSFWMCVNSKKDGCYHIDLYVEKGKLLARINQV